VLCKYSRPRGQFLWGRGQMAWGRDRGQKVRPRLNDLASRPRGPRGLNIPAFTRCHSRLQWLFESCHELSQLWVISPRVRAGLGVWRPAVSMRVACSLTTLCYKLFRVAWVKKIHKVHCGTRERQSIDNVRVRLSVCFQFSMKCQQRCGRHDI